MTDLTTAKSSAFETVSTEQLEPGPQLNGLTESTADLEQPGPQQSESIGKLEPDQQLNGLTESTADLEQPGPQQSESIGKLEPDQQLNGLTPEPPLLLTPCQTTPFQSFASQPQDEDSVMLAGYETPKTASTPAHKSSALYFSTDSAGVLLHPTNGATQGGEELDEMKLISNFHEALSKACKAGKAIQVGCNKREACGVCLEGSGGQEESRTFEEQYAELIKYEQHLKRAYERESNQLKEQLQAMDGNQKENYRDHEIEMLTLARKHREEKQQLKNEMAEKVECLDFQNLKQKQSEVTKLKKRKKKYNDECKEASALCAKLAEKEKSLHSQRCQIEELETTLRRHLLTTSKDHIKQQLKTCEQIEKMVERLPNMSGSREMDEMVEEISAQVEKMRSLSTNKRRISWKR